jgi:hypothetical protein
MDSISVNDVVSVELFEGSNALGVVYRIERRNYSAAYYYIHVPGKRSRVLSFIPFPRERLTFVDTKEQYQITNPEFFL